jgi:excisionase family DNA binding protein
VSDLLKTPEACAYLRIGRTKLFQLASLGRIRRTHIGTAVRWRQVELENYLRGVTSAPRRMGKRG